MLLRVSSMQEGVEADLTSIMNSAADSGLPNSRILSAFAEAVVGSDDAALKTARHDLLTEMGPAALVDSAGVVATFMQMDRLADSAGIVQDRSGLEGFHEMTSALGFDRFPSVRNTPASRK